MLVQTGKDITDTASPKEGSSKSGKEGGYKDKKRSYEMIPGGGGQIQVSSGLGHSKPLWALKITIHTLNSPRKHITKK